MSLTEQNLSQPFACLTLAVSLDGIEANDTKESQIMIGEEGIKIAKDISSQIKNAVDNGNLSLTINGTVFIADKQSLNISDPKRFCTRGQTLKGEYCCKFFNIYKSIRRCCKQFSCEMTCKRAIGLIFFYLVYFLLFKLCATKHRKRLPDTFPNSSSVFEVEVFGGTPKNYHKNYFPSSLCHV